jgi:hypothetical protein
MFRFLLSECFPLSGGPEMDFWNGACAISANATFYQTKFVPTRAISLLPGIFPGESDFSAVNPAGLPGGISFEKNEAPSKTGSSAAKFAEQEVFEREFSQLTDSSTKELDP